MLDFASARPEKVLVNATGQEIIGRIVTGERIDGLDATLDRMHSVFGSGADPEALFRIGTHRDLVGRQLEELARGPDSGAEVILSDASAFEDFDEAARYVPAHIVASFTKATAAENIRDVAVAINGKIRAVTQTYANPWGERTLSAMVPESAFREGFNSVEIFEISEGDAGVELASIAIQAALRHVLHFGPDGRAERISVTDGRAFAVVADAVQGEVTCNGVLVQGLGGSGRRGTRRGHDSVVFRQRARRPFSHRTPSARRHRALAIQRPCPAWIQWHRSLQPDR